MELGREVFATAFAAVFFSFIVAKLVSRVIGSNPTRDSLSASTGGFDRRVVREVDEEVVMEELLLHRKVEFEGLRSESRSELVQHVTGKVDEFPGERVLVEEVVENRDECRELPEEVVEVSLKEGEESSEGVLGEGEGEFDHEEKDREVSLKLTGDDNVVQHSGESVAKEAENSDKLLAEDEQISIESTTENEVVEEREEIRVAEGESERKVVIDSDDDWEGIERSELEKVFAEAAKFVESGDERLAMASAGSDELMDLYGLHKVATEGPCHEQPPMALKVSARAKWHWLHCARNAWQRLGDMSPEVAMEQYIARVSDRVPGWMEEKSTEKDKSGLYEAENRSSNHPDLGIQD